MERKAVSQRASRPFGVPQLSMKQGPRPPFFSEIRSVERGCGYFAGRGIDIVCYISEGETIAEASSRAVATMSASFVSAHPTRLQSGSNGFLDLV